MSNWSRQRSVFPKTYSRKSAFYKPWKTTSLKPMPVIETCEDPKSRHGNLRTPQNTPTSSESDSTEYTDSTQFLSLSGQLSESRLPSSHTSSDSDAITKLNPEAPYHYGQKHEYSIIIEESDDTDDVTSYIRPPEETRPKVKPRLNRFGRKLPQTKMMRDSMGHYTESDGFDEVMSNGSDLMTISSASERNGEEISPSSNELSNIAEPPTTGNDVSSESDHGRMLCEEDDSLPDIEVMRDAPPLKIHRKRGTSRRGGDLASSLKVSAMKLHSPGGKVQTKLPYKRKPRIVDRKNSTFKEAHIEKPIQEFSFGQDISEISGGQTSTSDVLTDDDSVSTIKPNYADQTSDDSTLKQISPKLIEDPVPRGTPTGYIRTPKKHSIRRIPLKKKMSLTDTDSVRQVCFSKTNQESLYMPGSKIADISASPHLPRVSPSISILKNAVATWNLAGSPKEKNENQHGAITSTPLWRRRSRNRKPNMMDLSFEVSAVPLPSYDDLTMTSVPVKKPVRRNAARNDMSAVEPVPSSNDDEQMVTLVSNGRHYSKAEKNASKVYDMSVDPVISSNDSDLMVVSLSREENMKRDSGTVNNKECDMSVDPMPSGDDDDTLVATSLPKKVSSRETTDSCVKKSLESILPQQASGLIISPLRTSCKGDGTNSRSNHKSPRIGIDATPSKQLESESPGPDIPARPTKKRAMRIVSNNDSDRKMMLPQRKQKRLEYERLDTEMETCIITRLPDRLFSKKQRIMDSTKPLSKIDMNFFNGVPDDNLCTIPDSAFQVRSLRLQTI